MREACLKYMFTYSKKGAVIPGTDGNNKDFLLAMPEAANIVIHDILRVYPNIRFYTAQKEEAEAEFNMHTILGKKFMRFADDAADDALSYRILPDGDTLLAEAGYAGEFRIYYHEAPEPITSDTADDFEPNLKEDAAVLVPLGMAAELFKEDEESIAATLWNEYAQRLEALGAGRMRSGEAPYISTTGWVK